MASFLRFRTKKQDNTETILQKGEIRVYRYYYIGLLQYSLVILHQLSYVEVNKLHEIKMIQNEKLKDFEKNFDGKFSLKLIKELIQIQDTHVFQAALRTPWLKNYEPFNSSMTETLIYSILNSAHESVIECILTTHKDQIDWKHIDAKGNSIFHIAFMQTTLSDEIIIFLIKIKDNELNESIRLINNNNESLLSISFNRQSPKSQSISKQLLKAGATIFVQKDELYVLPKFKIHIGYSDNQVTIILQNELENQKIYSLLSNPDQVIHDSRQFITLKSNDLVKKEHFNSLLQILPFPCPNLIECLLKEKFLITNENFECGSGLLHLTAEFGHTSVLRQILVTENLILDQRELNTENNALHKAIMGERCDNLKVLLMHNDPKIITCLNTKNKEKLTPIELAIRNLFYPGIVTIFENSLLTLAEHWLPNVIIAIKDHKSDLLKVLLNFFSIPLSDNSALLFEKTDPDGCSILHVAVLYYNEEIFELVLQKYFKYGVSSKQGPKIIDCEVKTPLVSDLLRYTPLILSLKRQQFFATEKLLKAGASDLLQGNLCYFRCLVEYCREETFLDRLLKLELKSTQFPINNKEMLQIWQVVDCEHNTLLHYSFKCNNHVAVKLLAQLTQFCDYSKLDVEGNSILHTAARLDSSNELTSEFIIGLRKHRPDVSYTKLIDSQEKTNGYSALMLAVKNANSKMSNFLMEEKASLLLFDNKHNSILHIIVEFGKLEFFEIVMNTIDNSKCTDFHILFHTPNDECISPIEKAVLKASVGIVRSFRQIHNINFTNSKTGLSLLHLAVITKSVDSATRKELMNELLNETSLLESKDKNDQTPTFLAVSSQDVDSLEILLTFNPNLSVIDKEGFTMLQRAIEQYNKVIFDLLILYIESRQDFREVIHFQGNNGKDALSYAIETENYEATEKLLSLKPPLSTNDNEGNTYIHIACKFPKSRNILKLLIAYYQKRVNLNLITQQNLNMFTPLLYAIYHKNINACQVLLFHKANLFYFDVDGVQQFHSKIVTSKLTFCEYSSIYHVGYSFIESQKLYWVLSVLNNLSDIRIISNTTVQSIKRINNTLVDATITQPSSQLLNMLLIQLRPFPQDFNPIYDLYIPAAKKGSMSVIIYLINEHIHPEDYLNTTKSSILYESINNHDDDVLLQFFEKVSDLPNTDFKRIGEILITDQTTHPLILCLNLNKPRIFSYLLMEKFQIPLTFADQQGYTIVHEILRNNSRNNFCRILINEVKKRRTNVFINRISLVDCLISESKQSPLHICAQNYTDCLSTILELNPDPTSRNKFGNTALHLAVKAKSLERTRKIAKTFEKIDEVINAVNSKQHTPLHIAVIGVSEEIVKELLGYRANIYSIDADKKTVLHHSVLIQDINESLSMVKIFLEYEKESPQPGNNLLSQSDNQGMTALHIAIKCSNIKVTEYLLEQQPDLSSTDHHHNTVFHLAVEQKSSAIINSLLRANGLMDNTITSSSYDFFNMRNSEGNTALSLAIRTGNENYTNLILGIQPRLDISDNEGNSTLHLAVQSQSENILRDLLRVMKSMNPEGIQDYLNAINNDGLSPLHYAITLNNHIAARILCDNGAQLAINLPNGTLTLCNGISGLRLRIFSERTLGMWNTVTTFFGAEGCKYFVCYTFGDKIHTYAISCLLPELSITQFTYSDKLVEINVISEGVLRMLTQCNSIEPFASAINNKLIDFSEDSSLKLLYNVLGTASIQITDYLDTHYPKQMNTPQNLNLLIDVVAITNNSKKIKECLKGFPPLDNLHSAQPNKNVDVQVVNNIIKESLRISLSNDSTINLKTLLDQNARINYLYGNKDDHTTLLHIVLLQGSGLEFFSCILEEIEKRESTIPKSTLINGIPLIECQNQDGKTVLHLCIENGNKAMLEKLFYCIPDMDKKDNSLNTIMHLVAKFCDDSITQFLFEKIHPDEYPYFFQSANTEGCSPLHLAASAGKEHMCSELLIRGTPLYSTDYQQQTVLHYSLKCENKALRLAILSFILAEHTVKKGMKDFLKIQDKDGRTALHVAVYLQYEEEIDLLIQADPSVIEVCDKSLQTPLHLAINPVLSIPNERIFEKIFSILNHDSLNPILLQLSRKVINQKDVNDRTPLQLSENVKNTYAYDKIKILLSLLITKKYEDEEIPTFPEEIDITDVTNNDTSKNNKIESNPDMNTYLNTANSKGLPPLHIAINYQHWETAVMLIQQGASLCFPNDSGKITLCDNIENLQLIFSFGCKPSKSVEGRTYYIGYLIQGDNQSRWIMSDLPELSSTIVTDTQSDMISIVTKNEFEKENLLDVILRCHSSEPLASAFRRNFLDPFQVIKGKHLSQIVGMSATPEVMCYYLTHFNGTVYQHMGKCPSILESAVSNPDISTLCIIIQALPKKLILESKFDQQLVSKCFQNSLLLSLNEKDTKALDQLLTYHPSYMLTCTYGKDRSSLLHIVVNEGKKVECAESILKVACEIQLVIKSKENVGFQLINFPDATQRTVLHHSILNDREDMLTLLLSYHPDLGFLDFQNDTPLHLAVNCCRKQSLVRTLLTAINCCQNPTYYLEARNMNRLTPLLLAATKSNQQIIQELLNNKADLYARDSNNSTILHRVLEIQTPTLREAMMSAILEYEKNTLKLKNNLITSQQDIFGSTPLHIAVIKSQFYSINVLITAEPSALSICDISLQTTLHLSVKCQQNDILKFILQNINDQLEDSNNLLDKHILCYRDVTGKTALHLSIENQNSFALQQLLHSGACIDVVDSNKDTILHTAVRISNNKCEELNIIIRRLKECHSDKYYSYLSQINGEGYPPLHLAIELEKYQAAYSLVQNAAGLCYRNEQNKFVLSGKNSKLRFQFLHSQLQSSKDNLEVFWIGYLVRLGGLNNWIATRLPELNITEYLDHKQNVMVTDQTDPNLMKLVLKCQSLDPYNATRKMKSINQTYLQKSYSESVGKHSTREVIEHTIKPKSVKQFEEIEELLYMLRGAVSNPDVSVLQFILNQLPCVKNESLTKPLDETADQEAIMQYSIAFCLKEATRLSLDNDTVGAFEELIKFNFLPDNCYENGNSLLHLIVIKSKGPEFISSLFSFDRNSDSGSLKDNFLLSRNKNGDTALHLAIKNSSILLTKFLLQSNAPFYPHKDDKSTLLHLAVEIVAPVHQNEILESILNNEPHHNKSLQRITRMKDEIGYTPLHLAIVKRHSIAVGCLIKADPDVLYIQDVNSQSPIHLTIIPCPIAFDCAEAKSSSEKNSQFIFDIVFSASIKKHGKHGTDSVCNSNHPFCIQDKWRRTAMHYAIQYSNKYAFGKLLQNGSCINIPDKDGNMLIHEAANNPDTTWLKLLTGELGKRINM